VRCYTEAAAQRFRRFSAGANDPDSIIVELRQVISGSDIWVCSVALLAQHIGRIIGGGAEEQMERVHTQPHITPMQNPLICGDLAIMQYVGDTVCGCFGLAKGDDLSIASIGYSAQP
jgi:hypothetical protein